MGCCSSRPASSGSPYPGGGGGASASARAINDGLQQPGGGGASSSQAGNNDEPLPSPASNSNNNTRRRHHPRHLHQSLAQHINKPLRRHEWSSRNRIWTRRTLDRERVEFFDTRVTGRQEIWQTIRAALEVLWAADMAAAQRAELAEHQHHQLGNEGPSEEDPAIALATAQSILTAADITLPTGDLAQGAYDSLGNYYSLPEHIVSDPQNIARGRRRRTGSREDDIGDAKAGLSGEDEDEEDETAEERENATDNDDDETERRKEEKGKAVVDVRDLLSVRARLSDGSKDVTLSVAKGDSVRTVARQIAAEAHLPSNKRVRIAYMGKILREGSTLSAQGWKQGHVINALVFNR